MIQSIEWHQLLLPQLPIVVPIVDKTWKNKNPGSPLQKPGISLSISFETDYFAAISLSA